MPSSIESLLAAARLKRAGMVRWGQLIPTDAQGVYVVSSSDDATPAGTLPRSCPLSRPAIEELLATRPELAVDGARPTPQELATRLEQFWLPDEHVVYIGLAASLSDRVSAYYGTPLGAARPHAGGWFLKTLSNLDDLFVHFAECDDRAKAESMMIGAFCSSVSESARAGLRDPEHPFPFANLEWPPGIRKAHGITGARGPSRAKVRAIKDLAGRHRSMPTTKASLTSLRPTNSIAGVAITQRVTGPDKKAGRIRVPSASKRLLPNTPTQIAVVLRGEPLTCSYDPRNGPPARSGVISLGRSSLDRVATDETLRMEIDGTGQLILS